MSRIKQIAATVLFVGAMVTSAASQAFPRPLDPARSVAAATSEAPHAALPEEYIWTANDVTAKRPDHGKFPWNRPELRVAPHLFRAKFHVAALPADATLYVAGPREAHVYLNGHRLDDFYLNTDAPIGFHVFHASVSAALLPGDNVLAIEAVRGRGIVSGASTVATQQLTYGEVLAAKIVPGRFGVEAPALVISDGRWRSMARTADKPVEHWTEMGFDDSSWPAVESLGGIESSVDFLQWSADAGMYGWPGYMGMSPGLRTFSLPAAAVSHVFSGRANFGNMASLTGQGPTVPFTVTNENGAQGTDADAPSLLLDFGREIAGRLLVESASSSDTTISIAYGESEIEALATGLTPGQQGGNYLGTNVLEVPANGVARGPKSGFRYVCIRFLRGAKVTPFKSIRAEGIYYPVTYAGSFESSDPALNRIWEVGAYTAHLCMQDGIWDAVKRDRGRWAGDLDIEGRVISAAFGDRELMEATLRALVPSEGAHVNGIPGYSALWIASLYDLYSRAGDREFVSSERAGLVQILATMDASLDADGLFGNAKHQWLFVDWAPGLYGYTSEAIVGTNLQYAIAYNRASLLFRMLGDQSNADKYGVRSDKLLAAIRNRFRDAGAPTFGATWQLNALAYLAFESDRGTGPIVWSSVLSHVKQDAPADQAISPYFNAYVLDAMAATGHRKEALDWIRTYWGGMLAEGATSFWESYDLRWPKTNAHLSLEADGTSGYFVSLAHGWSSGPTAWLAENVLGIREPHDGYKTVVIAPQLGGLDWARGTVPTPHGIISISIDKEKGVALDLPAGIEKARVWLPIEQPGQHLYLNGVRAPAEAVELTRPGHYELAIH
jgi:alpha-L-rhamnosidase